ncbi:uncharacterized protein HO173_005471 [Neofusicoccum parvum]|uniref:Uncharacterized protein HO173_005471 n=1 Tax=Neofusicoccum parvum TaxID=310453 RepID=A0ACB5RQZ6_9PEZI|nr:uncharacterized protein HO173_005471 [Neofusicoccum parvum]
MGGQEAASLSSFTENEKLLSMDSVAVFDVAGAKWYHQPVSGDVPSDRDRFCIVGVQDSSNSTYEIFLYSGQAALNRGLFNEGYAAENGKRDEVFVLSLPSFTWSKADYNSSDPRIYHTCHGVGRYLLSIGGVDPSKTSSDEAFADDDLYEQGIKVFDMTTMQWLDEFKADGASYQKPVVVSSRIAATPTPTSWADDQLRQLFEKSNVETATPAAQQSSGSSRISTGAIVGAAVGGFAGVAIICLLMFFWRKRMLGARRNASGGVRPSELSAVGAAKHEMAGDSEQPAELGDAGTQKPAELSTTFDHHELAGSEPFVERHEIA